MGEKEKQGREEGERREGAESQIGAELGQRPILTHNPNHDTVPTSMLFNPETNRASPSKMCGGARLHGVHRSTTTFRFLASESETVDERGESRVRSMTPSGLTGAVDLDVRDGSTASTGASEGPLETSSL